MRTSVVAGPAVAALLACLGCGTAALVSHWHHDTYSGTPFKRFLVIGSTPDEANREVFETEFVRQLAARVGTEGVASHTLIPDFTDLDSLRVVGIVREGSYDAVLVTRLVRVDQQVRYMSGERQVVPETYYNNLYDYYYTVYREVHSPGSVGEVEVVVLETNVYETKAARLVWTGHTESYSPENIPQIVDDLALLVLSNLEKYKFIQPTSGGMPAMENP